MFEGVRKEGKKEGCRSLHIRIWVRGKVSEKRAFAEEVEEVI